jgi:nitroreductase
VDVAFATMLLLLGAVEEGLGALFFGLKGDPDRLRAEFGIPPRWQAIGAVALGWRAEDSGPAGSASRGRKSLDEIVHRGGW